MLHTVRAMTIIMMLFSNQTSFCMFQKLKSLIEAGRKNSFAPFWRFKQNKPNSTDKNAYIVSLKPSKRVYQTELRFIVAGRTVPVKLMENLLKHSQYDNLSEIEKSEKLSKEGIFIGGNRLYSMNGKYFISGCTTDNIDDAIRAYYAVHGNSFQIQNGDVITLRLSHEFDGVTTKKKCNTEEFRQNKARFDRWVKAKNKQVDSNVCHSDTSQL
ncbi:hypothetical protein IPH67_02505 [bacterium]|nr:MAG: hypothetical protein IPH67_02505 [bacterium]